MKRWKGYVPKGETGMIDSERVQHWGTVLAEVPDELLSVLVRTCTDEDVQLAALMCSQDRKLKGAWA